MQIQPILAALRRHRAGTVLIALQIALTLAIVCNALFIIQQRLAHLSEPTGIDEATACPGRHSRATRYRPPAAAGARRRRRW
jgi:hypothetical protein